MLKPFHKVMVSAIPVHLILVFISVLALPESLCVIIFALLTGYAALSLCGYIVDAFPSAKKHRTIIKVLVGILSFAMYFNFYEWAEVHIAFHNPFLSLLIISLPAYFGVVFMLMNSPMKK